MRLSLNWLKDFVNLTVPAADLADRLTLAGLEVEALEEVAPDFSGVVVGRVIRVEPHPQADRLQVAEVEDGRAAYRVVCGAPNLESGRLYPFAPTGRRSGRGPRFGRNHGVLRFDAECRKNHRQRRHEIIRDRKSTRLNSSHT